MAVEISQNAYLKLILHTLRYPNASVNGILLGKSIENNGSASTIIEDAIPLFHSHLELAPMTEAALSLIDSYCTTKDGSLSIVGVYHANELFFEKEVAGSSLKIANCIRKNFADSSVLLVDNVKLQSAVTNKSVQDPPLKLYKFKGDKWEIIPKLLKFSQATTSSLLLDFLEQQRFRELVDFEEHLSDISKDWLNQNLC